MSGSIVRYRRADVRAGEVRIRRRDCGAVVAPNGRVVDLVVLAHGKIVALNGEQLADLEALIRFVRRGS